MARWRLLQPHYLNVPGTKWEYVENDRKTNRPKRTEFPVPLHLDPKDITYWTEVIVPQEEGYINVCHSGKGHPNDIVFVGDPSPDMMPLDDEAATLTAEVMARSKHPIESLPGQGQEGGYAASILDTFTRQFTEAMSSAQAAAPVTVQVEGVTDMMAAMTKVMEQNAQLLAAIAAQSAAAAEPTKRRV